MTQEENPLLAEHRAASLTPDVQAPYLEREEEAAESLDEPAEIDTTINVYTVLPVLLLGMSFCLA